MTIGSRSLLFGAHQIALHPYYVARAWRVLYGRWPRRAEWLAILTHDWGYWGSPDMDGETGTQHPGRMARWWRGRGRADVAALIEGHSRHYAQLVGAPLSLLYAADKLSVSLMPAWLYLLLARMSGELSEYMRRCAPGQRYAGQSAASPRLWHLDMSARCTLLAVQAAAPERRLIVRRVGNA